MILFTRKFSKAELDPRPSDILPPLSLPSTITRHPVRVPRLIYLVPEEDVALGELELCDVELLCEGKAHHIETGEDPAATGGFLVCHRLSLCLCLFQKSCFNCEFLNF